jgi:hypothetical protein
MSNNSIRIRTTPNGNDAYLKVNIEQEFDFIEILSLKISQEEAYKNYCSDYGVVVGRVIVNSGFGVPNAKVSIFIPIDEVDKNNPEIKKLYPYEVVTDKNDDGIRYNLLPKCSESDNSCYTPIGTFPSKREVLDNDIVSYVYCKYYKFTTTTNYAGDFMIFGVPVGTYTLHVDADMSDVGIISQRPYDSISQGTPQKFFDSPTKFKKGDNLDSLSQVKSSNVGVNVQPFWGDKDNCQVGISRVDIDLNTTIIPSAIFMGSIFGDQDKNSISKRCRPRADMGKLCEQTVGEGSIEMIRETIDGKIESFDVDGGRVIDENGSWAYQIPMNLDYMVTDEEGKMTPSDDPTIGIPTRANVRFRIGMDPTGGEGRLRTRAKYLIPNNPTNQSLVDYEFGENTKKTSLKNIYWNKIYSVSNFISRFQVTSGNKVKSKMGIKDVDACAGDKNPFPYNRVSTYVNPLFFVICILVKMIVFIVFMMNKFLVPVINTVISGLNGILKLICITIRGIGEVIDSIPAVSPDICGKFCISNSCSDGNCNCTDILDYVPCITIRCPSDDGPFYAPGCRSGSKGFQTANDNNTISYYPGDSFGHNDTFSNYQCGLDDCINFQVAQALNLIQFDFYNDWINGSLYSFLVKYKKKIKLSEKFCEYDCDDFGIQNGGVDGNKDGNPDNKCHTNFLLDSCYPTTNTEADSQLSVSYITIREGLIKKYKNEFYYAATMHDGITKLFATDLISLGSVFSCDWQGIPKIQQYLIPTTYILPPDAPEPTPDNSAIETNGQISIDGTTKGLFFTVDCKGLHSNKTQCLNLRHICEYGVELDELRDSSVVDGVIGKNEIDDATTRFFRDTFYLLNKSSNPTISGPVSYTNIDTTFNIPNCPIYNFATNANCVGSTNGPANASSYLDFRGFTNDVNFQQPKHSFYFYFGLVPGSSGLDRLNQRFFTPCTPESPCNIVLGAPLAINIVSTTPVTTLNTATGTMTFNIVGGTGPFTFTISGPTPITTAQSYGTTGPNNVGPNKTINSLLTGYYTITAIDANGNTVSAEFYIGKPVPLYATAIVTQNCSTSASCDGKIEIQSVGGGTGPYKYKLIKHDGTVINNFTTFTAPNTISNLCRSVDSAGSNPVPHSGYTIVVQDSLNNQVSIYNLLVDGPKAISLTSSLTGVTCCGGNDGRIKLNYNGGSAPYTITTTGPNGYTSTSSIMQNLIKGSYNTTIVDSLGTTALLTTTLNEINGCMRLTSAITGQCNPNQYTINFKASGFTNNSSVVFNYAFANVYSSNLAWSSTTKTVVNANTNINLTIAKTAWTSNANYLFIRAKSADGKCFSNYIDISKSSVELPPNTLSINETGITNSAQTTLNSFSFKFNISHLSVNNSRAPYSLSYYVIGYQNINGGGTSATGSTQTINNIVMNQQPGVVNNASVPAVNGVSAKSAKARLTLTDNKGCKTTYTVGPYNITPSSSTTTIKPLSISGIVTNVKCCNVNNGVINISASGGTAPYTYTVIGPNNYNSSGNIAAANTSTAFNNLASGTYTFTVIDSNNLATQKTFSLSLLNPCITVSPAIPIQCDPTKHTIKYSIVGLTSPQSVIVEYSTNNTTWTSFTAVNYNAAGDVFTSTITPAITTNPANFYLRVKANQSGCINPTITIPFSDVAVPPSTLVATNSNTSVFNTPNYVTINFNVSHFPNTSRLPYTVSYSGTAYANTGATGSSVIFQPSNTIQFTSFSQYPLSFVASVPNVSGLPAKSVKVSLTVTDSKGCKSAPLTIGPLNYYAPLVATAQQVGFNQLNGDTQSEFGTNRTGIIYDVNVYGGSGSYTYYRCTGGETPSTPNNICTSSTVLATTNGGSLNFTLVNAYNDIFYLWAMSSVDFEQILANVTWNPGTLPYLLDIIYVKDNVTNEIVQMPINLVYI